MRLGLRIALASCVCACVLAGPSARAQMATADKIDAAGWDQAAGGDGSFVICDLRFVIADNKLALDKIICR